MESGRKNQRDGGTGRSCRVDVLMSGAGRASSAPSYLPLQQTAAGPWQQQTAVERGHTTAGGEAAFTLLSLSVSLYCLTQTGQKEQKNILLSRVIYPS